MKKQLLALAMLSAILGVASVDAQRLMGGKSTAPHVIIERNKNYFLNITDSFFNKLKKEHKGALVIHRNAGTAPVKNVIATYENPKYSANKKSGVGANLDTVTIGFVQTSNALAGNDEHEILLKIDNFFKQVKKENPKFVNIHRSEGTQSKGIEFASYRNPITSKKGAIGAQLETIVVEFTGKNNGNLLNLKQRPTEDYPGLTKQQQQELLGGNKEDQAKLNAAIKADHEKRAIINSQRYGNE